MQYAVETRGLRKTYRSTAAVDGIDLLVPARSVTGFLGPNGAGKTTAIRMLLGLLKPDAGQIRILEMDMPAARRRIARQVGSLVETPSHYDNLTGSENLQITQRLLGLAPAECDRVLELMDLTGAAGKRVGEYSLGMRQRLGIARALLGRPRLLILDEPTNGLDPDGIVEVRKLIRGLPQQEDTSVLVSSHLLAEVEQTVDHVALIHGGKLLAQGPLAEVLAHGGPRVLVEVADALRALQLLSARGIDAAARTATLIEVRHDRPTAAEINSLLVGGGIAVSRLTPEQPSLERVYLALTDGAPTLSRAA
jgi:ABC-2 type transport system ATP-binding protein